MEFGGVDISQQTGAAVTTISSNVNARSMWPKSLEILEGRGQAGCLISNQVGPSLIPYPSAHATTCGAETGDVRLVSLVSCHTARNLRCRLHENQQRLHRRSAICNFNVLLFFIILGSSSKCESRDHRVMYVLKDGTRKGCVRFFERSMTLAQAITFPHSLLRSRSNMKWNNLYETWVKGSRGPVSAVKGRELSVFCNAAVAQVPERLISSFTKLKQLISSSRECLALSILIRHLVTQSPRFPFCQLLGSGKEAAQSIPLHQVWILEKRRR
uniref:Uncharacterized protein n=1 Tax=Salix viminalis TaxID=40686 RepID=A0A6N2JZA4_SALVM